MGWRRFFDKRPAEQPAQRSDESVGSLRRDRRLTGTSAQIQVDPTSERKIAELRRRRGALLFDIEQGELALQEDNPWRERIDLLSEAHAAVESEIAAIDAAPTAPALPVDPIPIRDIAATGGDLAQVSFTIAETRFRFEEQVDWDQRGGPTVRGDLQQVEGNVDPLIPPTFSVDARRALHDHLADSIVVFATDLRDRALEDRSLPESPSLADLAKPCPTCGGWRDWHGRCPACTTRDTDRQRLRGERDRLDDERRKEADEQYRLAESLPIARRRLVAVEADLRAIGADPEH